MQSEQASYSIKNPYHATFIQSEELCSLETGKDTRHIQIKLPASQLPYVVGDSLCVIPKNHPQLVAAVIAASPCSEGEKVTLANGEECSLDEALLSYCTIAKISSKFFKWYAAEQGDEALKTIAEEKEQIKEYITGRDILDLLQEHPIKELSAQDLVDKVGKVIPRLYSIASSQNYNAEMTELTIAMVEWDSHQRKRYGVASTYLGHRCQAGDDIRCYVHHAKKFKLPENTDTDIIMVGPGTGIAPFRAFMQDRVASAAKGRNWLYFGDWRREVNYYYADEWQAYVDNGQLQHLDLAFSRDQDYKIYVQHLIDNNAEETWQWLDSGAHFYVCGDANRMAKDVETSLHKLIAEQGGKGEEGAVEYVKQMAKDGRYQRDVY